MCSRSLKHPAKPEIRTTRYALFFQELFPEGQSQNRYSKAFRVNVMRHLVLKNIGVSETAALFHMPRRTVYDWLLRWSEIKIRIQKRQQGKESKIQVCSCRLQSHVEGTDFYFQVPWSIYHLMNFYELAAAWSLHRTSRTKGPDLGYRIYGHPNPRLISCAMRMSNWIHLFRAGSEPRPCRVVPITLQMVTLASLIGTGTIDSGGWALWSPCIYASCTQGRHMHRSQLPRCTDPNVLYAFHSRSAVFTVYYVL